MFENVKRLWDQLFEQYLSSNALIIWSIKWWIESGIRGLVLNYNWYLYLRIGITFAMC